MEMFLEMMAVKALIHLDWWEARSLMKQSIQISSLLMNILPKIPKTQLNDKLNLRKKDKKRVLGCNFWLPFKSKWSFIKILKIRKI